MTTRELSALTTDLTLALLALDANEPACARTILQAMHDTYTTLLDAPETPTNTATRKQNNYLYALTGRKWDYEPISMPDARAMISELLDQGYTTYNGAKVHTTHTADKRRKTRAQAQTVPF